MITLFPPVRFAAAKPTQAMGMMDGAEFGGNDRRVPLGTSVIKTPREWSNFWGLMQLQAPKGFDATKHMAVVIAVGPRINGGFGLQFDSAEESDGQFKVFYTDTIPRKNPEQANVYPYAIKIFPKTNLPVVAIETNLF